MNGKRSLLASSLLVCLIFGCDYARMNDQESIRTYKAAIPEMPAGTIPVADGFVALQNEDPKNLKNPVAYDQVSVERGKQAYAYFCIQCHGPRADGNGTVGQSFAPLPSNLASEDVQGQSDGELYAKILLGFGRHPMLFTTVSEQDAWAVVNYIRSLKKKGA